MMFDDVREAVALVSGDKATQLVVRVDRALKSMKEFVDTSENIIGVFSNVDLYDYLRGTLDEWFAYDTEILVPNLRYAESSKLSDEDLLSLVDEAIYEYQVFLEHVVDWGYKWEDEWVDDAIRDFLKAFRKLIAEFKDMRAYYCLSDEEEYDIKQWAEEGYVDAEDFSVMPVLYHEFRAGNYTQSEFHIHIVVIDPNGDRITAEPDNWRGWKVEEAITGQFAWVE